MPSFLNRTYINPVEIGSLDGSITQETRDLNVVKVSTGHQRWELSIGLEPIVGVDANTGNIAQHRLVHSGNNTSFDIVMPQTTGYEPKAGSGDTLSVAANAAAGAVSVSVNTSATHLASVLPGHFISFTGHTKVYMIVSKSGGALGLYPRLYKAVTSGTVVSLTPNIKVKYDLAANLAVISESQGEIRPRLEVLEYYVPS